MIRFWLYVKPKCLLFMCGKMGFYVPIMWVEKGPELTFLLNAQAKKYLRSEAN